MKSNKYQDSHIYRYFSLQKQRKQIWKRGRAKSSKVILWLPADSGGDAHLELEGSKQPRVLL